MLISPSRRLALALLAAALILGCKKKPAPDDAPAPDSPPPSVRPGMPTPGGAGGPGTPPKGDGAAGWTEVRDPIGGFRVSVPGRGRVLDMTGAPAWRQKLQMTMTTGGAVLDAKVPLVQTYSLVPPAEFKLGSSPDELYAGLLLHEQGVMTFQDALAKEPIKLGGRPGLRVLAKANNFSPPPKVEDPEHAARLEEGYKKDVARRKTYLVTTTATRVIVIMVQSEGDPNPADLKTIIDSFAFL